MSANLLLVLSLLLLILVLAFRHFGWKSITLALPSPPKTTAPRRDRLPCRTSAATSPSGRTTLPRKSRVC